MSEVTTPDRSNSHVCEVSIGFDQASALLCSQATALGSEVAYLGIAAGRILADLVIAPLLNALAGGTYDAALDWSAAPLRESLDAGDQRDQFLCAEFDGQTVRVLKRQAASAQALLAQESLIVRVPVGALAAMAGALVATLPF
jgi:molybdopterin biosynthesis enzyme